MFLHPLHIKNGSIFITKLSIQFIHKHPSPSLDLLFDSFSITCVNSLLHSGGVTLRRTAAAVLDGGGGGGRELM